MDVWSIINSKTLLSGLLSPAVETLILSFFLVGVYLIFVLAKILAGNTRNSEKYDM